MIRLAGEKDALILAELAVQMWNGHTVEELAAEFAEIVGREDAACFIQYAGGVPAGFAQCQLRYDYVEGTASSPVGYLEGIFVREDFRNRGIAKALLRACEAWAKEKNCSEFASDCELNNVSSLRFHLAMGFEEVNRVICLKKDL